MTHHISAITRACYFHLRRIRQVKRCLNEQCIRTLVQAFVISRVDYCNSVLTGLPSSSLKPLTSVLHAAARLVKDLGPRDHITPTLRQLHWLPIPARINFKICLLMFNIFTGSSPSYLSSLVSPCSSLPARRRLRSTSRDDFVSVRSRLQFGNRAFAISGPTYWNSLPVHIRQSKDATQFKTKLKTYLFSNFFD